MKTVAITGASGFIGSYCVREMVTAGYDVRAVVRSPKSSEMLRNLVAADTHALTFAFADLLDADAWREALRGCDAVLHVASPMADPTQADEAALIKPAVDGTASVLKAARDVGVQKVVVTSSLGAVCGSAKVTLGDVYTADDWTDPLDPDVSTYNKSKTLAEKEARRIADEIAAFDLVTVNPGITIGPLVRGHVNRSNDILFDLAKNTYPVLPPVTYEFVDVRDVARIHRCALESGEANERILCSSAFLSFAELEDMVAVVVGKLGGAVRKTDVFSFGQDVPESLLGYVTDFDLPRPVDRAECWSRFAIEPIPVSQCIQDTLASAIHIQ